MPRLSFRIDPLFLVLAFGLGWLNSSNVWEIFLWAAVVFISILIHELGHALTLISFGQSAQVTFMAFGGLTSRLSGKLLNPLREFFVVLNGPLAGFALYLLCRFLLSTGDFTSTSSFGYMLLIGSYVNLIWTVLNLFPVLPLDGGRMLQIILEKIFGVKGGRIAYGVSFVCAAVFALLFFLGQEFFAGAIFLLFAFESYREFKLGKLMQTIDEDSGLKSLLNQGVENYQLGDVGKALPILEEVSEKTKKGLLHLTASYYLAKAYEELGELEKAYSILQPLKNHLNPEQLQDLQRIAFLTKRFSESARIGQEAFRENPNAATALINAFSLAQIHEVTPAVGWFETSIREGLENPLQASRHLAFDSIRNEEAFTRLINKIKEE